jgi:hypothetical protein
MPLPLRLLSCLFLASNVAAAAAQSTQPNLILVTLDGMRWQEVFHGLDAQLLEDPAYTTQRAEVESAFAGETAGESAVRLMPFLHEIAQHGALIGDFDAGSCARVTNPWYFSYPGYNEILTGKADPAIASNDPVPNANVTFLEWLNHQVEGYAGKVAAFASWNVFPAIINSERSGVPVNVGASERPQTAEEKHLARLQADLPQLWNTVRLDALTHYAALDYLKTARPRVLYVAYGETDDFAHDGYYDRHVFAAHRSDRFIRELWDTAQSLDDYRDNTILFITTDHGRGSEPRDTWRHHASAQAVQSYMPDLGQYQDGIGGSNNVWMAALGPGIAARGMVATGSECAGSNQIAATLLTLLGLRWQDFADNIGAPLTLLLDGGGTAR